MTSCSRQQPGWMPYGSAQLPGANGGQGGGLVGEGQPQKAAWEVMGFSKKEARFQGGGGVLRSPVWVCLSGVPMPGNS